MAGRSRAALIAVVAVACGRVVVDVDDGRDASIDSTTDSAFGLPPDSYAPADVVPQAPDAQPPPIIACDDAGACPLPPSMCLDSDWFEYFDDGVCQNGSCHYDAVVFRCTFDCDAGCVDRPTTPNVPVHHGP